MTGVQTCALPICPSGCGKTTLLRIIAGLEEPDCGQILFQGKNAKQQSVRERRVGFVFQHYALFRHMTVYENIAFGLKVRPRAKRLNKPAIKERVHELLNLVQLDHFADRFPMQLAGGQRQRIALARALAIEPRVLLLDEPFGALDAQVRQELRRWLRQIHEEIHVTSVFVTHDQEEAMEVADQVVVMNYGHIEQIGEPEYVYHHPATPFVFTFLGDVNLFHGRIENGKLCMGEHSIDLPEGQCHSSCGEIYIRPHQLDVAEHPVPTGNFRARISRINAAGPVVKIELMSEWNERIQVELSQERYAGLQLRAQQEVYVFPRQSIKTVCG